MKIAVFVSTASPALTVSGGAVVNASGMTYTDSSDEGAAAILVTGAGSSLILSSSTINEADTEATPLISVESGGQP